MARTCSKCSRINPPEASYCYHDGVILDGQGVNGSPISGGKRGFTTAFVFPSGRSCANFDELAIACNDHWDEARALLKQGFLENFLGNLGRSDLALAAREAARFPDPNRGLDQLLARLPSDVLAPPRLHVEPQELTLGILKIGVDRQFDLHLENQGQRLLYGSVTVEDCPWLALGDAPGTPEKLFEFGGTLTMIVRIVGDRLRASVKPLEGNLAIESNGGNFIITIRAEVPVQPFADGVLAGALAPRQIAEKAKVAPKEAALLFEKGAVAQWYKENGWAYPVLVPSASGLGAVQQFFEALGLTAPPRVDISDKAIQLDVKPGESLRRLLEVKAQEKRPVWAHATSDQPWLEVGRTKLNGRKATIPLAIPSVPNRPGETLTARVVVTSNGNQRFVVPVTLTIGGAFNFVTAALPEAIPLGRPVPTPPNGSPVVQTDLIKTRTGVRGISRRGLPPWLHALPAALLGLILMVVVLVDLRGSHDADQARLDPDKTREEEEAFKKKFEKPDDKVDPHGWYKNLVDQKPYLAIGFSEELHRFGLVALMEKDPKNPHAVKKLTSSEIGANNNTCVRVNGSDYIFGRRPGRVEKETHQKDPTVWTTVWEVRDDHKIEVTQTVMLVPGDRQLLDTCLVRYRVENKGEIPKDVGLRIMLDTYIGSEDGVPFSVPGRKPPLVEDMCILNKSGVPGKDELPDYIQALERPNLADPGTVVHLGLKGFKLPGVDLEEINRVVICRWPIDIKSEARWAWNFEPMNKDPEKKDSCVVIYWADLPMRSHEVREMAFTYGLNAITTLANDKGPELGLFAPRAVRAGDEFTATAYLKRPQADKPVELVLPEGFSLVGDAKALQPIKEGGDYSQVSWRVKAAKAGEFQLQARHGDARVARPVEVLALGARNKKSIFD